MRFDVDSHFAQFYAFLKYLPILLLFRIVLLFVFSLNEGLWRYVSVGDLVNIIGFSITGSLLFSFTIRFALQDISYPKSIYVMDCMINIFLLGGIRLVRRLHEMSTHNINNRKRAIVIGAGDAAEMLLRDINYSSYYPYKIIGLIDDDSKKTGFAIRNIKILGTRKELKNIITKYNPDEFIITIPSAKSENIKEIIKDVRNYGVPVKILPGLWDILNGNELLSNIQLVESENVLFRAPVVNSENNALKEFFRNKKVMITGAGGSIGSELSRQISELEPENLILFERNERNLYDIDLELHPRLTSHVLRLTSIIGDILDEKRVIEVMEKYKPDIIFHAAAYKHVPLMEHNPNEAYKTNVLGTKIIANFAKEFSVERFILISTDKAVSPVNVMGKTKKLAEEIIQYYSVNNSTLSTKYITVRFGNVLDSSGSVVPLFRKQIKNGGPVTVTHPEITRYFMTIPEAVNLVLEASVIGEGSEIFVLDMGKPIKIVDLAKRMINLYGYRPGIDINIDFIGLRSGEKLHEELFNTYEKIENTKHPKIHKAISNTLPEKNIANIINLPNNSINLFKQPSDT
jgi:FlaA1/EpsC-like NDP-sugar epimerase